MKLVSNTWLRNRIEKDPDIEFEAGFPSILLANIGMFIPTDIEPHNDNQTVVNLKMAFGTLIRQLRRRDSLTYADLSARAHIEEDELRSIEHDAHFIPRPRTVHNLAKAFDLPVREVMKLSGATVNVNPEFHDAAVRFAAKSDDLCDLSNDERRALNEYIKFLNGQHDAD